MVSHDKFWEALQGYDQAEENIKLYEKSTLDERLAFCEEIARQRASHEAGEKLDFATSDITPYYNGGFAIKSLSGSDKNGKKVSRSADAEDALGIALGLQDDELALAIVDGKFAAHPAIELKDRSDLYAALQRDGFIPTPQLAAAAMAVRLGDAKSLEYLVQHEGVDVHASWPSYGGERETLLDHVGKSTNSVCLDILNNRNALPSPLRHEGDEGRIESVSNGVKKEQEQSASK